MFPPIKERVYIVSFLLERQLMHTQLQELQFILDKEHDIKDYYALKEIERFISKGYLLQTFIKKRESQPKQKSGEVRVPYEVLLEINVVPGDLLVGNDFSKERKAFRKQMFIASRVLNL